MGFLLPMLALTLTSSKWLAAYILMVAGIPITTFMPSLSVLGFLGGLAPQAAFLLCIVLVLTIKLLAQGERALAHAPRVSIFLAFLAYAALSLVWTDNWIYGVRFWGKLAAPVLMLLFVVIAVRSKHDIFLLVRAIAICVIAVLTLALLNFGLDGAIGGDKVRNKWMHMNIFTAPYMSPANFSFFIFTVATLTLAFWLTHKKPIQFLAFGGLTIVLIGAYTRISMAALVVSSACCIFLLARSSVTKLALPVILILGFCFALLTFEPLKERMFYRPDTANLSESLTDFDSFQRTVNTSGRLSLWQDVVQELDLGSPILGAGLGSVDWLLLENYNDMRLHSELLRLYLDLGWIGVTLYLLAIVQIASQLLQKGRGRLQETFRVAAIASLLGYCTTLVTDNTLNYVTEFGIYVFTLSGIAFAARGIPLETSAQNGRGPGLRPKQRQRGRLAPTLG